MHFRSHFSPIWCQPSLHLHRISRQIRFSLSPKKAVTFRTHISFVPVKNTSGKKGRKDKRSAKTARNNSWQSHATRTMGFRSFFSFGGLSFSIFSTDKLRNMFRRSKRKIDKRIFFPLFLCLQYKPFSVYELLLSSFLFYSLCSFIMLWVTIRQRDKEKCRMWT